MAAVSRKRHVSSAAAELEEKRVKIELDNKVETILQSKKHANAVFDIFEILQVKFLRQSSVFKRFKRVLKLFLPKVFFSC